MASPDHKRGNPRYDTRASLTDKYLQVGIAGTLWRRHFCRMQQNSVPPKDEWKALRGTTIITHVALAVSVIAAILLVFTAFLG